MIFWQSRSVVSAMRARKDDRPIRQAAGCAPVRIAEPIPFLGLLYPAVGLCGRSGADAADRRGASQPPVRGGADAPRLLGLGGHPGGSPPCVDTDEEDGHRSAVPASEHQRQAA